MYYNYEMLYKLTSNYRFQFIAKAYAGKIPKGSRILDIGCGNGFIASKIAELFRAKVTGCDLFNYLKVNIPFIKVGAMDKLPFKDKEFTVATYNDMLHHASKENQVRLIKEGLRVAKTVLIFEDIANTRNKILDVVINKIHERKIKLPLTHRTEKEWIE